MVPEGRGVFARLLVTENLEMGAYSRSDKKEVQDAMERVFTLFPRLKERRRQVAGTYLGASSRCLPPETLMSKPTLMLMDEPSMGLAPVLVELIFDTIRKTTGCDHSSRRAKCTHGALYRQSSGMSCRPARSS